MHSREWSGQYEIRRYEVRVRCYSVDSKATKLDTEVRVSRSVSFYPTRVGWMGFGPDEPNKTEVVGFDVTNSAILLLLFGL